MSMFGALVRTVVNVATLPVTLPIAIVKDTAMVMDPDRDIGSATKGVVQQIKDDADE